MFTPKSSIKRDNCKNVLFSIQKNRLVNKLWDQQGTAFGDIVCDHLRVHEKVINYIFSVPMGCQGRRLNLFTTQTSVHMHR